VPRLALISGVKMSLTDLQEGKLWVNGFFRERLGKLINSRLDNSIYTSRNWAL